MQPLNPIERTSILLVSGLPQLTLRATGTSRRPGNDTRQASRVPRDRGWLDMHALVVAKRKELHCTLIAGGKRWRVVEFTLNAESIAHCGLLRLHPLLFT